MNLPNVEEIRQSYKPDRVSILFIGESAPAKGTFFYTEDSLCTYTREAFALAFGDRVPASSGEFLHFFQQSGCYLDDLSLIPINEKTKDERERLQLAGMPELAKRMHAYQPQAIVCMLKNKTFKSIVQKAAHQAGLANIPFQVTPFGGNGQQGKYRVELKNYLLEFQQSGLLHLPIADK